MKLETNGIYYISNMKNSVAADFADLSSKDAIKKSLHLAIIRLAPLLRVGDRLDDYAFNVLFRSICEESEVILHPIKDPNTPIKELFNFLIISYRSENPKHTLLTRLRLYSNFLVFDA